MSNNHIVLPDFVIANLYGNNLVVGNDVVAKERPKPLETEKIQAPNIDSPVVSTIPMPAKQPSTLAEPMKESAAPNTIPTNTNASKPAAAIPVMEQAKSKSPIPEPGKQWFLGNNGKNITVLVKETTVPYINDSHLQFLSNVLSACKLNLGDIALVNFQNYPLGFEELKKGSNPTIIVAFDLSPKELKLPFTIPVYQVQDYAQCRFLFAPSLSKMEGNLETAKAEKTKLWNSLKILFQL